MLFQLADNKGTGTWLSNSHNKCLNPSNKAGVSSIYTDTPAQMQPLSSCESSRSGGLVQSVRVQNRNAWNDFISFQMKSFHALRFWTYSSNSFNTLLPKLPCFQKHYSHSETWYILQTHFWKANHLKIFAELNINANLSLTTSAEQFPFFLRWKGVVISMSLVQNNNPSLPTQYCATSIRTVDTNGASVAIRDGQHADRWGNTAQTAPCRHTNTLLSVSMQEIIMFYNGMDDLPTTLRFTDMNNIGVIICVEERVISSYGTTLQET